jgi:transposase
LINCFFIIQALSRTGINAPKRLRLLAISHFLEGENLAGISRILKVSGCSVNKWVANYLSYGLPALEAKRQPYPLSIKQREQLSDYIDKQSRRTKGSRLTGETIRVYTTEQFQINYHPNTVYKMLHQLGFSWITSRSKHPK